LSRILVKYNGWTLSDTPNGSADINYFNNYITYQQKYPGWNETPTAAYFSHYDEPNKDKAELWHEANEGVG
jgi:hypothetical protein